MNVETPPCTRGEILVAVYRPERPYLDRQIRSIREQTLTSWTCRLGIDGHDPETAHLLAELTAGDDRFVLHHYPKNVGFYRNFERLVSEADKTCDWIALSDQDDDWDSDKLQVLVEALAEPAVQLVTCQARIVDSAGTVVGHTRRKVVDVTTLLFDNQVTGSLTVLDPQVAVVALPFPGPTPAAYHDHWLGVVAATMGGGYRVVDRELQSYVQHGANVLGEETKGRGRARLARLTAGGAREALDTLANDRWGWRQRMAAELVRRLPSSGHPVAVRDVALGKPSVEVFRALIRGVRSGEVAPGRATGLAVGGAIRRANEFVRASPQ